MRERVPVRGLTTVCSARLYGSLRVERERDADMARVVIAVFIEPLSRACRPASGERSIPKSCSGQKVAKSCSGQHIQQKALLS